MQTQIIIEKFLRSEKSRSLKLCAYERIILFMIASYMGKKKTCWPPYEDLMQDCGIGSKSTFNKFICSLESKKILVVERAHRKNNKYSFDQKFYNLAYSVCTQRVRHVYATAYSVCTPITSVNNINNKSTLKSETRSTVKFWENGNPDYDRINK